MHFLFHFMIFFKHATIFLCLFSITSNILNHTNLRVYFMCKDRKDVLRYQPQQDKRLV